MVLSSLKVTVVRVGVAHADVEVVGVPVDVPVEGQPVFVAELHGPEAEPPEQEEGNLAEAAPHEAGMALARALFAVKNAA